MTTEDFKRKLTAVFCADVAGYSRLMAEDETATVKTLETYKQMMFSLIKQHRGRVVDSPGDNLLAEFASVVEAVQCGVAIQKELQLRNADLPENRRMQFRIGINLGDVIEEGERIYGDGVNIAARLEALADPGGMCVSKTAFDHIESKLPLCYQFLGEQTVKNITKPIGAYKILMEPRVLPAVDKERAKEVTFWGRRPVFVGAIVVLILIIGVGVWNFYFKAPKIEPASKERMAYSFPDKPSIAVLPFVNMSDDPKQEYLADGLAEEIINALSKLSDIFVIARNSTFTYKGEAVKIQQVAEELGVQYVLEGSLRKMGDEVRITAQLVDALTGNRLISEQYDGDVKDIFAIQDEMTIKILTSLRVSLAEGESVRTFARGTKNLEAYLKVLQTYEHRAIYNKESLARARQLAEEAITLDPEYALPYSFLALTLYNEVNLGYYDNPQKVLERAYGLAERAVALDNSLAWSNISLGLLSLIYKKDWDKAIAQAQRAIAVEPGSAQGYGVLGSVLIYAGRYEEAIPYYEKAFRLSPRPLPIWLWNLASGYIAMGQYDEAIKILKRIAEKQPDQIYAHTLLTTAYVLGGMEADASKEAAEVLRIDPSFSVERSFLDSPYKDKAEIERRKEALRKAGLK